jgi:hypothetical protein
MKDLSRNLLLYKRMKDLAVQQGTCVSQDRMDLFLQLADQRERLRLQITANEENGASTLKDPPSSRRGRAASSSAVDIADVIRSIQEIDRKTEEFVFRRREAVLTELAGLRKGRQAVRGYGGKAGAGPARFLDRNG